MCEFILASGSPRRKEILRNLGLEFTVCVPDADENIDGNLPPELYVQELALLKAGEAAKMQNGGLIISADTVVYMGGKIMGKPGTKSEAKEMLESLSGNTHSVYTGVCAADVKKGKFATMYEKTDVTFYPLTEEFINKYIESGEPFDKAGGYGIQ